MKEKKNKLETEKVFIGDIQTPVKNSTNQKSRNILQMEESSSTEDLKDITGQYSDNKNIATKTFVVQHRVDSRLSTAFVDASSNELLPITPDGPRFHQDGNQLVYTQSKAFNETFVNLHAMQMRDEMCDVILRVQEVDFKAHKVVLAAACPYFAKLFKPLKTIRKDRLILQGLTAQSVAAMISYFYTAKLIIDAEDVSELLDAACYFQTMDVVELCSDYLELNLAIHNCFKFYRLAMKFNLENLRLKAFRFICWNFKSICKEDTFYEISTNTLIHIISNKQVKVKSEEEIYIPVWNWYKYNTEERGKHLSRIVEHIHFDVMNIDFLENTVKKQMYNENELCKKKVDDVIRKSKTRDTVEKVTIEKYRQISDNIYIFNGQLPVCKTFDIVSCKTGISPEMDLRKSNIGKEHHVTIKAGKDLYTITKSKTLVYEVSKLKWTSIGEGVSIEEAGICSNKSSIFVAGGRPNGKQFWQFDCSTNQWSKLKDMDTDRRSPGITCMGNAKPRIYVAGGFSVSQACVLDTIVFYLHHEQEWKTVSAKLIIPRFESSMMAENDRIFIVGGRNSEKSLNTAEIFDRRSEKVNFIKSYLSEAKTETGLVNFEGNIYSIGGKGCRSIDRLDENENSSKWVCVGQLDFTPSTIQCVVYQPV